jgi:hypothetical protein
VIPDNARPEEATQQPAQQAAEAPVCYVDQRDKRRRFVLETVPAILANAERHVREEEQVIGRWMLEHGVFDHGNPWDQLGFLHEAARKGRYVRTRPLRCDRTQSASKTLADGGDCDQWASLLLAACRILGIRASLCAFGDPLESEGDPYQHVATVAEFNRAVAIMDPKGNQAGASFNEWPALTLTGAWR